MGQPQLDIKLNPGPWKVSIESRLDALEFSRLEEERLRDEHPGVKDAYEKYQMMLKLAK